MLDRIKLGFNCLLPKKYLTKIIGWIASKQARWFTKIMIDIFIWYYNVDITESKETDTSKYKCFNDFFTRPLKNNIRPINLNSDIIIQPADGVISQIGKINNDQIFQAKNHFYSLESLLAGNYQMANKFINGNFVTIYIEPKNYHRIHMPYEGILKEIIYVPGELNSLNKTIINGIPNIFARNERVICYFNTCFGPFVQILVGATIVGSIKISKIGIITPPRYGIIRRWSWRSSEPSNINKEKIIFNKGDEMGLFKMGSTVINLYPQNKIGMLTSLSSGSKTFVGQTLANILNTENNLKKY